MIEPLWYCCIHLAEAEVKLVELGSKPQNVALLARGGGILFLVGSHRLWSLHQIDKGISKIPGKGFSIKSPGYKIGA